MDGHIEEREKIIYMDSCIYVGVHAWMYLWIATWEITPTSGGVRSADTSALYNKASFELKDDITIEVCPRCHAKIHKSNDPAFARYRPMDEKNKVRIGRYGIRWVKRSITIPEELYIWAKEFAEKKYWNVNHVFVVALIALKEQVEKHGYMDI